MKLRYLFIATLPWFLVSCASVLVKHDYDPSSSITQNSYAENFTTKGVVMLSANWSRAWNCGEFENAELRSIGFDLLPSRYNNDKNPPDFVVNGTAGEPGYTHFAFPLDPGEYAISHIQIKAAKSVTDVGYFNYPRSKLLESDETKGGSFNVIANETVYIGHFYLDCAFEPLLWRYYIETKSEFQRYVNSFKANYPFLNTEDVKFRLFKTTEFGREFELR